ncbi:MAG: hypothetical protein LBN06_12700 [Prevotellaceae bacterium]|nr:hypothetical protein [Prevotellaceae bacterium]
MTTAVQNSKFFNTARPIQPDIHYCVEPLTRFNLLEIESLTDRRAKLSPFDMWQNSL